ncbi:MAG: phenylacetate--CoA ligase family protein, partial [Christensenellales bacterium]
MNKSATIFNPEIECMSKESLEKLQLKRLQETVAYCYHNSSFYRKHLDAARVSPDTIKTLDDIRRLPFTNKTDLRDNYPFGMFSASMKDIVRIHASSGTTGKPTTVGYTQNDIGIWSECCARALGCAGATQDDIVHIAYGYGLFTGGLGLHYGVEKLGATALPISSGNTVRQIMLMQDFGSSILACTPSYALMLFETIKEMDIPRKNLKLRAGIFGAEPWTEEMRQQIEGLMDIDALDIYGLSETMGPGVSMECREAKHGMHIWEDYFIIEIINPDTGEPLPDGEFGEVAITTLAKEGIPTLRYRTHDISCIISEPCPCGRTHRRLHKLTGRTDDMLIIRGINVFPSQIESVLVTMEGIAPHYLLVIDRVNNLDILEVHVELSSK